MTKAVSRTVKNVDFDAQAAARDAARREGKSLGEWLHGVIADHAADSGVGAGDVAGQERVNAVTSRLERLGSPRQAAQAGPSTPRALERIGEQSQDDSARAGSQRSRRAAPQVEDAEELLDDAVEQMDRHASQSERRTEETLATVAKMMETGEARRARESAAVVELTQKLTTLETKLTQQFAAQDNPVKGALARLEARLELIGKRNAAEADAKAKAAAVEPSVIETPDAVQRLEEKLNIILRAVESRPVSTQAVSATSHLALRAAQKPDAVSARRSLGDAIAEIAERQQLLEDPAFANRQGREQWSRPENVRELRRPEPRASGPDTVEAVVQMPAPVTDGIADLIARVDEIRRDLAASRDTRLAARPSEIDDVRSDIAAMSRTLQKLEAQAPATTGETSLQSLAARLDRPAERIDEAASARPAERAPERRQDDGETRQQIGGLEKEVRAIAEKVDILRSAGIDRTTADMLQNQMRELGESALALRAMITTAPGALALEKIEERLERLAGKVDEALIQPQASASEPKLDTSLLEGLVRELGHKIEAVQAPTFDNVAIEALQNQVEQLSERFARSEQGLSTLPTLAASVRELFDQLETTRASVETSAAHAAREVLRIAAGDGRNRPAAAAMMAPELEALKDADQRIQSTLGTVHTLLEKVVDRLSHVESDIADVRRAPASSAAPMSAAAQRPAAQRPPAPMASKAPERAEAPNLGLGGVGATRDPIVPLPVNKRADAGKPVDLDENAQRSDFIAAARRAAKSAQAEPSVAALKRPPGTSAAEKASRADILAKSRDYVATHKRPVLMGLAAILMVLGTIAVLQRMGLGSGQEIAADNPQPRTSIARMVESRPGTAGASMAPGDLSPSALPKASAPLANAIPGSDPVQTGSIPSLPAFAAQSTVGAPRSGMPSGLLAAAEAGNGDAQYELGARYSDGRAGPRDPKLAALWLEKAANQGLAPARYRLASLYEKGAGVAQDKAKAKSLYTQAADAGNPRAMHNLAVMLADGDGHPDYAGAAVWFRKAANYGIHDSQYNLAILLARGLGVQQSLVQSYQWFAVAASKHDEDAARKRDEVGAKMNPNDLAVAKALAAAFQPKTANSGVMEIEPPAGGWDGATSSSRINSAKSKISSL